MNTHVVSVPTAARAGGSGSWAGRTQGVNWFPPQTADNAPGSLGSIG